MKYFLLDVPKEKKLKQISKLKTHMSRFKCLGAARHSVQSIPYGDTTSEPEEEVGAILDIARNGEQHLLPSDSEHEHGILKSVLHKSANRLPVEGNNNSHTNLSSALSSHSVHFDTAVGESDSDSDLEDSLFVCEILKNEFEWKQSLDFKGT